MITKPKGTQDILPNESEKWQYIEEKIRNIARQFNLHEIRTPTFEVTELFTRGVGETTDIVHKEMYTFLDKGERSITLKPEGTAGVVRAFLENGLFNQTMPQKLYYISPIFRYERPQSGRLREHHQFGVEVFGSASPFMDAEVISMAYSYLKEVGVQAMQLQLNSVGCPKCRPAFNAALKAYFEPYKQELCENCQIRFEKNTLRILDCKIESCKNVIKNAPKITDYLCTECSAHFTALQQILSANDIPYIVNPQLVRGLDYYTKTVFEFVSTAIGAKGTVLGGGRYDNLVANLGGKSTCAIGFGSGIERLLLLLEAQNRVLPIQKNISIYIAPLEEDAKMLSFQVAKLLREKDFAVEMDVMNRSIKAQFKYANSIKANYVVSIGHDELQSNTLTVKNMQTGKEEQVERTKLVQYLQAIAKEDV